MIIDKNSFDKVIFNDEANVIKKCFDILNSKQKER